eukprot:714621_1
MTSTTYGILHILMRCVESDFSIMDDVNITKGNAAQIWRLTKQMLAQNAKEHNVEIEAINSDSFKAILLESAEATSKQQRERYNMGAVIHLLNDNVENIGELQTFINLKQKGFADLIRKHCKIHPSLIGKLYDRLFNSLQESAQIKQFGAFLSDLCIDEIDKHYHHIITSHINNGDADTIKNTFKFFNLAVHYEDGDISKCISIKRRHARSRRGQMTRQTTENSQQNKKQYENISIALLQNHRNTYNQTQLDIYHSYLVHSDWKEALKRYINQVDPHPNQTYTNPNPDEQLD